MTDIWSNLYSYTCKHRRNDIKNKDRFEVIAYVASGCGFKFEKNIAIFVVGVVERK